MTAPGNVIVHNFTYANEDSGINIYPGANRSVVAGNVTYDNGDHGIDDLGVSGGRITGNTVYRNCTSGINVEGAAGISSSRTTWQWITPPGPSSTRPPSARPARTPITATGVTGTSGCGTRPRPPREPTSTWCRGRRRHRVRLGRRRVPEPVGAAPGYRAGNAGHLRQPEVHPGDGLGPSAVRPLTGHRLGQLGRAGRAVHRHPGPAPRQ